MGRALLELKRPKEAYQALDTAWQLDSKCAEIRHYRDVANQALTPVVDSAAALPSPEVTDGFLSRLFWLWLVCPSHHSRVEVTRVQRQRCETHPIFVF